MNYSWEFQYNGSRVVLSECVTSFTFWKVGNYSLELTATDLFNNSANTSLWVNVLPVPDTQVPRIYNVTWPDAVYLDDRITIYADITDNIGIAGALVEFQGVNGSIFNYSVNAPTAGERWLFGIPSQGVVGEIWFRLLAYDLAGNWNITDQYQLNIVELKLPEPPFVLKSDPANNTEDVPLDKMVSIWFSKKMNKTAVESAVEVIDVDDISFGWAEDDKLLILDFSKDYSTEYIVLVRNGAVDLQGLPLGAEYRFTFYTAEADPVIVDDDDNINNNDTTNVTDDDVEPEDDDETDDPGIAGNTALIIIAVIIILIFGFSVGIWIYIQKKGLEDDDQEADELGRIKPGGSDDEIIDEFDEEE